MDCLRSFNIRLQYYAELTSLDAGVKFWGTGNNINCIINDQNFANFSIQGFKNINLYGFRLVGDITPGTNTSKSSVISDWAIQVGCTGQPPLISGNIDSGTYALSYGNVLSNFFLINKYSNEVKFESPITSATLINFSLIKLTAIHCETNTDIGINADLNFTFYYNYEGE